MAVVLPLAFLAIGALRAYPFLDDVSVLASQAELELRGTWAVVDSPPEQPDPD